MNNPKYMHKLLKKIKNLQLEYEIRVCLRLCVEGYESPSSDVAKAKFALIEKRLAAMVGEKVGCDDI